MTAGLQEFIIPVTPLSSRSHPKLTSAIVEAIIGAVYLDRGLDAAKKVARGLKIEIYQDFTDQVQTLFKLAYTRINPHLDNIRRNQGLVNKRKNSQIYYCTVAPQPHPYQCQTRARVHSNRSWVSICDLAPRRFTS